MKKTFLSFSLVLLLIINSTSIVFAAAGDRDASFVTGTGLSKLEAFNISAKSAVQSDGKIITIGSFSQYNGTSTKNIIRLNTDGSLDQSFAPTAVDDINDGGVDTFALQSDGKIIAAGYFPSLEASVIRLNTDGSLDQSFALGDTDGYIETVVIQPDGKILIGGDFNEYGGSAIDSLVRLNTDGSIDTSLVIGGGFGGGGVSAIAVAGDGSLVVGGSFRYYDGQAVGRLIRLSQNGSLDMAFSANVGDEVGEGFDRVVKAIAIQSTGEILVGGEFAELNSVTVNNIVRLNTDGTVDISFVTGNGFEGDPDRIISVTDFVITPTGQIVTVGSFESYKGTPTKGIVSINGDGSIDYAFSVGTPDVINTVSEHAGKIIVSGNFETFDGSLARAVARLNTIDYSLDGTFTTGDGFVRLAEGSAGGVFLQSDGKVFVTGNDFSHYDGTPVSQIFRLTTTGAHDNTFAITGNGFDDEIYVVKSQSDGKVLVAGRFTEYAGSAATGIVRLNADGTRDNTFALSGDGINGRVEALALLSDGKILIGGNFTDYDGVGVGRIARLNADGSLDTTFNAGEDGFGGIVREIKILSDGKIMVSGLFNAYNGDSVGSLVLLGADGVRDNSFVTERLDVGFSGTVEFVIQSDGKIVVAGDFTGYGSDSVGGVIRLNTDGSLDTSFNTGGDSIDTANGESVFALEKAQDDTLFIVGYFTEYNNTAIAALAHLNADGTLDESFETPLHSNDSVGAIAVQEDKKIIIGGNFSSFDGAGPGIVRLMGTYTETVQPNPQPSGPKVIGGGGGSRPVTPVVPVVPLQVQCTTGQLYSAITGQKCTTWGATTTLPTTGNALLTKILRQGMTDPEVKLLQVYLNTHGTPVASVGAGSSGKETNFFGPATRSALVKFQELHAKDILSPLGLTKGTGVLAAKTIAFINANR